LKHTKKKKERTRERKKEEGIKKESNKLTLGEA
jgi:hypothetical protein